MPSRSSIVRSAHVQRGLLALADTIAIGLSFLVATVVAQGVRGYPMTTEGYLATAIFAVLWIAIVSIFGTYALSQVRAGAIEYKRVINASFTTAGVISIICYLLNYEYPRLLFGVWMLMGVVLLSISRVIRRRAMQHLHRNGRFITPLLIAGSSSHADEVAAVLNREKWLGYKVKGVVTNEKLSSTKTGLPVLGAMENLPTIVKANGAPAVVFAEGSFDSSAEFRRLAWQLEQSRVQMILAPTLADVSAERLEFRPVAGLPLVDVARPTAAKSLRWVKRSIDVVGSALFLILTSHILLATMIAIKLEDGGPIFFKQRRVGLNGEEFDCLKLRSMCVDAEARLAALQAENEGSGVLFKMKDDPRITRTGKIIRRFSVDELPQLWNVFRGDMSLVGPRPALPKEVAQYDSDTRRRLRVRPGLTGLWQVSGRSRLSWEDTVRLDLYYVDNWSLTQDMIILLRTAKAVVGSDGAY
ncbi:MAG: sugar transferase [Ancrocorticia sp.]